MANKTAALRLNLAYVGPGTENVTAPQLNINIPYQSQSHGTIDVPDLTAADTSYEVPFGSIEDNVTLAMIVNRTGQPLAVIANGEESSTHSIAANGAMVYGVNMALVGTGSILSALSLKTTAEQSGEGLIEYHLFGDPVAPA